MARHVVVVTVTIAQDDDETDADDTSDQYEQR
jgi:hypothetical protein